MSDSPLVSVIIPTYRRSATIRRAIESVIAQSYPFWEIIVVERYPSDGTDDLLAAYSSYSCIKYFLVCHDFSRVGAIAYQRNLGISCSRGDYLAFLDSDDWWHPDKLSICVSHLASDCDILCHSQYAVPMGSSLSLFKRNRIINNTNYFNYPTFFSGLIAQGNDIATSSVIVSRKSVEEVGGFSVDIELFAGEDYELWLKLAQHGVKYKFIPKPLAYYQVDSDNVSSLENTVRVGKRIFMLYNISLSDLPASLFPRWYILCSSSLYLRRKNYYKAISVLFRLPPALFLDASIMIRVVKIVFMFFLSKMRFPLSEH
jgi:glycosyltransferase involved in cell wall biosynthesis